MAQQLKYLVLDLESIPSQTIDPACLPQFDPATVATGNLKDTWKIHEKIQEARGKFEADLDKRLSVDMDYCQVCAVGYRSPEQGKIDGMIATTALEEEELIRTTWDSIGTCINRHIPIVTFNGSSFDIPILQRRAMLLDIYVPPNTVAALLKRYDNTVHFDLMQILAGRNPFSGKMEAKKLDFYLRRFGLGSKSDGWDGSMVYPAFKEGRHQEILEYCKRDVEMTAALFERVMPWITTKSLSAAEV